MDDGFGKRIPGATIGRDGRSAAPAWKGSGYRKFKNELPTDSADRNSLEREAGDHD